MAVNFENNKCCGCMACMNICPKNAIYAYKDEKGFIYPKVDYSKCINCGICEKICDFNKKKREDNKTIESYSLINTNKGILQNSTSGGAFTALSNLVLKKNGLIYGTIMDNNFDVYFTCADSEVKRNSMRGSKYVQSNTGLIYRDIKKQLEASKEVLFIGTPCQVGGLKSFLRKDYDNLITIEFLCHGVPNNEFFKSHIHYLENKFQKKAKGYTFRDKKFTWNPLGIEEIIFEDNSVKSEKCVQSFNHFFHSNVSLRPSCLNCTYRKLERVADITIADFWGIKQITHKNNSTGVSLLLANSLKGLDFIKNINDNNIIIENVPYDKIEYRITTKPSVSKYNTDDFWSMYNNKGYEELVRKYATITKKEELKFYIKKFNRCVLGKIVNHK